MKYQSLTTPDVQNDQVNALTELILLNKDVAAPPYPWRGEHKAWWGKTVAALRRIMKTHGITADQIAFYVYRCNPIEISSPEFAKMAVVAKKLFRKHDLGELIDMYRNRRDKVVDTGGMENAGYAERQPKRKTLAAFLEELENGQEV